MVTDRVAGRREQSTEVSTLSEPGHFVGIVSRLRGSARRLKEEGFSVWSARATIERNRRPQPLRRMSKVRAGAAVSALPGTPGARDCRGRVTGSGGRRRVAQGPSCPDMEVGSATPARLGKIRGCFRNHRRNPCRPHGVSFLSCMSATSFHTRRQWFPDGSSSLASESTTPSAPTRF